MNRDVLNTAIADPEVTRLWRLVNLHKGQCPTCQPGKLCPDGTIAMADYYRAARRAVSDAKKVTVH